MPEGLKRFSAIFRQNIEKEGRERKWQHDLAAAERQDDRRIHDDYIFLGQAAPERHLRDFREDFYRELREKERDQLRLLLEVKPETKRPYAYMEIKGVRYEITLIPPPPHLRHYGVRVWKVVVTQRRKNHTDYAITGFLRESLHDLFEEFSPEATGLLDAKE